MKLGLLTDSASDLPAAIAAQYGIEVVSSILVIDGQAYIDGKDITREEFYTRLPAFKSAPTTAAPLPRDATPGQAFAAMRVLYERRPQRDFTPADWRAWETEKTVLLEQVWGAATNAG